MRGGGEHMVWEEEGNIWCERRRGHMVWEEEGDISCERRRGTYERRRGTYGVGGGGEHMV